MAQQHLNNQIRRKGSFAPLSVHYYLDDALAQAGEAAELLYVRGLAFCGATLSDGFISAAQLSRGPGVGMKDAEKRAARLVEVGAWLREDTGWRVRTWLDWNRSRAEIQAGAENDRVRKARGGRSKPGSFPPGDGIDGPSDSERIPDGNQPDSDAVPSGFRAGSGTTCARLSTSTSTSISTTPPTSGQSGGETSSTERANSTAPRPRCPRHEHLDPDDPGPNCVGCRDSRLAAENAHAASSAATSERIRACRMCNLDGWRVDPDRPGIPVSPYTRCDHTTPHEDVLAAIAADEAEEAELAAAQPRPLGRRTFARAGANASLTAGPAPSNEGRSA